MKKVIIIGVSVFIFLLMVGVVIYNNVTQEVPVVCTLDNKIANTDEVELYVDGKYVKQYISKLDVINREGNSDVDKRHQFYDKYGSPQQEEYYAIYNYYGLDYLNKHSDRGKVTWIKPNGGGYSYAVYFDDKTFKADLISGALILKGIKIDSRKVTLDYFVGELEKQGYKCDE